MPGIWPPVTINGRRYIDGGVRSSTNTDLAAGSDRVLVIIPSLADQPDPFNTAQVVLKVLQDRQGARSRQSFRCGKVRHAQRVDNRTN